MIIRDTIQQWPYLTWGGSYAGTDNLSVDPTTSLVNGVEIVPDTMGHKSIRITVRRADNSTALAMIPLEQLIPCEQDIFDQVVKVLKLAIGKTLNEAGGLNI